MAEQDRPGRDFHEHPGRGIYERPGRWCPLGYRYGASSLKAAAAFETETLYVVGGLYGNPFALESVLEAFAAERGEKALVFNGDFHWFDVGAADFLRVNRAVRSHVATRGNVETELASPSAAGGCGCGCGYPEWVGDAEVERSNRIMERLRETARAVPEELAQLASLPMIALAQIRGVRIAAVHGDANSLAGWDFSQERLATPAGRAAAAAAFPAAGVRIFASSHTCLPVLQSLDALPGDCAIVNNGAAGMPNFRATRYGLATRISVRPSRAPGVYGARVAGLHIDALPLQYDADAWEVRFLEQWSAGSDAYVSYFNRIAEGPKYAPRQALRLNQALHAAVAE
ncbi:MAG: hypothetical protein HY017_31210 [Betaproteobacteria bacterium]|nr:hypothetical protein [Betaproteobacteria bacterium]